MNRLRLRASMSISGARVAHAARRALWLAAMLVPASMVQNGQSVPHSTFPQPIGQPVGGGIGDIPTGDASQSEDQLRVMNKERQKSMVSDAGKLLRLAGELDAEVRNSPADSMTPNQLRKLAEIEKLAHNVKDKMSYSVRTGPVFHDPLGPIMR